jgi:hypothetical protein
MKSFLFALLFFICFSASAQQLFQKPPGIQSRVSSFENKNGVKGGGGRTNRTAKGNAFEWIYPGGQKTLLDIKNRGIIQRIWLTVNQSPQLLRSLRLQMFWDGDTKAAVDVPLGDFFGFNSGRPVAYESALLSSPEGRSFNCFIPMPFKAGAKLILTNESATDSCKLFYDIDYVLTKELPANAMYFHAYWTRQMTSPVGTDFLVLPQVKGSGRFLGMTVGVNTDSIYKNTWWGEGEVKMYLDGDKDHPTINGTGAEDYAGTGWGMGSYHNQYQGCTIADELKRQFCFYRWHLPDAIYFDKDIKITLQQIGGGMKNTVQELFNGGVPLQPISIDKNSGFVRLLDLPQPGSINDPSFAEGWVNFYRGDDYTAVSYFYLDRTSGNLPGLPPVSVRTAKMEQR